MIRKLTLAAALAATFALPALAQQTNTIDPAKKGPTDTMNQQVPAMKMDSATSPSSTTAPSATAPSSTAAAPSSTSIVLSEADAKNWIGKPVYSSDNQKIGEVEAFRRGTDGNIVGLNAGVGGFLGLGETHVMMSSSQFKLQGDRVVTSVAASDAKSLPLVTK